MPVLRNQLAHSKRLWMKSGRFLWIGRGLAILRLTSIRSSAFPTVRSCLWGFLGSLRPRSQLISVSVSMQLSIILRRLGIALYRRLLSLWVPLPRSRSWTLPSQMCCDKIHLAVERFPPMYQQPSDNLLWVFIGPQKTLSNFGFLVSK